MSVTYFAVTVFSLFFVFILLKKEPQSSEFSKVSRWSGRLANRPKITILVILSNGTDRSNYKRALDSLECYSKIHGYNFLLINDNGFEDRCRQKDVFFRRHCIVEQFLPNCEYLLFLDADMGVVNPKRRIEEFIDEKYEVTFYDRFFNAEIVAGAYLLKNSKIALDFVHDFANFETQLPNSFHGTDNGALHALMLSKIYPNRMEDYQICLEAYNVSKNFADLFIYETCIRSIMGISENHETYRFLKKGTGWARDNWLTNSLWSPETDFMIHCWKSKEIRKYKQKQLPLRLTIKNRFTWFDPIVGHFDLNRCVPGNISWNYDPNLIGSAPLIRQHLSILKRKIQEENFRHLAKLTEKIK